MLIMGNVVEMRRPGDMGCRVRKWVSIIASRSGVIML